MTRVRATVIGIGLLLAIPAMAAVVNVNITGDWTVTVVEPTLGCTWVGPLPLVQTGNTFTGSATLKLQPGSSDPCSSSFAGTVSGTIVGLTIKFGVATGTETASFDGTIAVDQLSASGMWTNPDEMLAGTWLAQRVVGVRAPALNAAGLAVLLVLLLAGGVDVLRRRAA